MDKLNYQVLKRSGYEGYILPEAPEKVLQFGEGNFLRAFADYWFDVANERMWGKDLTAIPGFEAAVVKALEQIRAEGALAVYAACLEG